MSDFKLLEEPTGAQFVGLLVVLEQVGEMTRLTMVQLANYGWSDDVSRTVAQAWHDQSEQGLRIRQAIQSGFFDQALVAHGLNDAHPSFEFKRAVIEAAVASIPKLPTDEDSNESKLQKIKAWFRGAKDALSAGDVIVKSVASAIPIVGQAYPETKEATEIAAGIAGREDASPLGQPAPADAPHDLLEGLFPQKSDVPGTPDIDDFDPTEEEEIEDLGE